MLLSQIPAKMPYYFGVNAGVGFIHTVPIPSQIGVTPGAASFADGFPPLAMTALASGGVPPAGQDMNGVMAAVTQWLQWAQAGGPIQYDASFATSGSQNIGGYPRGAVLARSDLTGLWLNTTDNNTANPDSGVPSNGWVPLANVTTASIATSARNETLSDGYVIRSNAGSPMVDTLVGGTGAMPNGWKATFYNGDVSGILAFTTSGGATLNGSASSFIYIGPGQTLIANCNGTNYTANAPGRCKLNGSLTVYVATTGSDSANHGLTPASPFATLQKAWNVIQANFDLNSFVVTVQIADGTYAAGINASSALVGNSSAGAVIFNGNSSTPSNVAVNVTNNFCFQAVNSGAFTTQNLKVLGTGASNNGISVALGGKINVGLGTIFGAIGNAQINVLDPGSIVILAANYTVNGTAGYHLLAANGGRITGIFGYTGTSVTCTVQGTPNFSSDFALASFSNIDMTGVTFTGSATGVRYISANNALINTNGGGANFFPGNSAGSTSSGGLYA